MHIFGFLRPTRLTFVKKQPEHRDITTFYFSPARPLRHIAGQHGVFILPGLHGVHPFSLSSAPEEPYVTITTHVRQGSRYKRYLDQMQAGDRIMMLGPVLNFILRDPAEKYIFLAQGIGITPFRSILVHAKQTKLRLKVTLIHVDNPQHTFQAMTRRLATKAYYPTTPEEFTKNIEQSLDKKALYYVSGSPRFTKATKNALFDLGIECDRVITDSFFGY